MRSRLPFRIAGRRVASGHHALLPEEWPLLGPRATEKRRAELCAGRAAARAALRELLGRRADDLPILREPSGRPCVALPGAPRVSISHADGLALAAAGWVRLGLDLMTLEPLDGSFLREAFAPGELGPWERWLGALGPCAAFCAKEAALKWLGCGMRAPLHGVAVRPFPRESGPGFAAEIHGEHGPARCEGWMMKGRGRLWIALWDP